MATNLAVKRSTKKATTFTVADLVAAGIEHIYDTNCAVGEATRVTWATMGGSLDANELAELVYSGLASRIHDALHRARFAVPAELDGDGESEATISVISRATTSPLRTVTVKYERLEVRYMGADGGMYPIAKFLRVDVESVVERLDADIRGKRQIRKFFVHLGKMMDRYDVDRVNDLPDGEKAALNEEAPFLRGQVGEVR